MSVSVFGILYFCATWALFVEVFLICAYSGSNEPWDVFLFMLTCATIMFLLIGAIVLDNGYIR